ncbi:hypothetical protein NED98_20135 [Sphingomonas sp. MMSM20]|uniref:hypothetical protein n=1 Tax=Sphingomonas lycopersici TaxID=2951807 RepID=UPI0022381A01|nr:hypothetical protein [Sphingomonas lycopersici]MCW6532563.1 hypothetical protein [Sphingomonas lycopersici]
MKRIFLLAILAITACNGDWRSKAIDDSEALVRQQVKEPSLKFANVQFVGDRSTGQTCGYYEWQNPGIGTVKVRFISFIDGAGGQNPNIDDPSAPYPKIKSDFRIELAHAMPRVRLS